jgi:hypothetical protein
MCAAGELPADIPPSTLPSVRHTWHIHRAVLLNRAPDAQLAVSVIAPALDRAPGRDGARVVIPGTDCDGEET